MTLFKHYKKIQHCLVLVLRITANVVQNCYTLWDKTSAKLENNIQYDKLAPHNYINNPKVVIVDKDKMISLGDNMFQFADRSFLDQGVATKNKKLVTIISFCVLSYSHNKRPNLF